MIALEDYPQASWALQILERNWIQAHEWHVRFLSRLLRFVEPRYLCLVFGEAGYPLYITLHCKRKDSSRRSSSRYAIEFNDDGTVEAKVKSRISGCLPQLLTLLCRMTYAQSAVTSGCPAACEARKSAKRPANVLPACGEPDPASPVVRRGNSSLSIKFA
jgi:hypothetical protein